MFLTRQSWKMLLGAQSHIIEENDSFAAWNVKSKINIALFKIDFNLLDKYVPFTTYYLTKDQIDLLKTKYNVDTTKEPSICIDIENLSLSSFAGRKMRGIRSNLIRAHKYLLDIKDNLNNIEDLKIMRKRWSETSGEKYFQDRAGKNIFYYNNNFHVGHINIFLYKDTKLTSFGTLSMPTENQSVYIAGKALCIDYPGLSEYTDMLLYEKAKKFNVKYVELGSAAKGMHFYKSKFPGSFEKVYYHARISK